MSQESHSPKPDVGARKDAAFENADYLSSLTEAIEPPSDGKGARRDRRGTAETQPIAQDNTILTPAPSHIDLSLFESQRGDNCTPPVPFSLPPEEPIGSKTKVRADLAGAVLGDYKLLRKIGQGGMGEVYEAYQISTERVVALKLLARKFSHNPRFVQRLHREANSMTKVDHPNILCCFDVGNANGYSFLTMELIAGGNLEHWLKKLGRFSVGDALHIVLKVASALEHAHERNIIHRDVKPDNILLTETGEIKLADLGLAKDTENDFSLTKTGTSAGTPVYMAPEQARDAKHVDARVDIYALGVMLYVFLTGLPPFTGRTFIELIAAKDKGTFDPIRKHLHEIPPKLDLIVDRMLAMDPSNRFANCSEVIAALEALNLANESLSFLRKESLAAAAAQTKLPQSGKAPFSQPVEEEPFEKDVWYLHLIKGQGKLVAMRATTEQVCLLIKTRNLDKDSQISRWEKKGFRAVEAFSEFQPFFNIPEKKAPANTPRPMAAATQLNEGPGPIAEPTECANGSNTILWVALILAAALAVGGVFFYVQMIAAT